MPVSPELTDLLSVACGRVIRFDEGGKGSDAVTTGPDRGHHNPFAPETGRLTVPHLTECFGTPNRTFCPIFTWCLLQNPALISRQYRQGNMEG